jgi:anti-sigma B factor antagonist
VYWTEITERRVGDVTILELRGHLTLADDDKRLMRRVAALLAEGSRTLLLNLHHVSYIDSPGIGEIVGAFTRASRAGGTLRICEISPRVREVLEATNLDSVLEIFDSEEQALRTMQARE